MLFWLLEPVNAEATLDSAGKFVCGPPLREIYSYEADAGAP